MARDKTSTLRQLIPKSYHFDGYNEFNCLNSRDKPFFGDNVIQMGDERFLNIRQHDYETIFLEFSSVCPCGRISFEPYKLTIDTFVAKLKRALNEGSDFITFTITPRYSPHLSLCKNCSSENEACKQLTFKRPQRVMAAVSFIPNDIRVALANYYEINNKTTGGSLMKPTKKFFGMNFELGISKDPNIKSTMMGVSVRNPENGNWYVFDQASGTRKNMAGMKFGDFPVVLLPTKVLNVGDLVKIDGKYHYVKELGTSKTITLIGAADGHVREVFPEESFIPGMSMYTKVMAFDIKTLTDPTSKEGLGGNIMAAICMMQWAKGGDTSEFSLDNINDDSFNGLGACMPLLMMSKDGNLSSLFTNPDGTPNFMSLMMLGGGTGNADSDSMMQMMIMSQLLGGTSPLSALTQTESAPVTPAAATEATLSSEKVVCDKCGSVYTDTDVAFCIKCGGKTHKIAIVTHCKKCGAQLKPGSVFCHACGNKLAPDTCPNCGKEYDSDDAFCSGCGKALKVTGEVLAPTSATEPVAPESAEPSK